MILSCTPPPSANRLWQRTKNGMTKSKEYRAWLSEAGWQIKTQSSQLKAQQWQQNTGGSQVAICLTVPANGRRDLDNHCKPVLDLLVSLKLIDGDRFKTVKRITLEWHDKPAMLIEIQPHSGTSSLPTRQEPDTAIKKSQSADWRGTFYGDWGTDCEHGGL